jgi:hypothetical protein
MSHWGFLLTKYRITNFIVVEITPIGIQSIGWKFWIVWTVTNAVFLPILYFFYPETGMFKCSLLFLFLTVIVANRSLEDLDAYYRTDPSLIVSGDPDAICKKRPQKYIEREYEEFERATGKAVISVEAAEHVEWTEGERQT